MADVQISDDIKRLLAAGQLKDARQAAQTIFEKITNPSERVAFTANYYEADPGYRADVEKSIKSQEATAEERNLHNQATAALRARQAAPPPPKTYKDLTNTEKGPALEAFTKMRLSEKSKLLKSLPPEDFEIFMQDMADAYPDQLQSAIAARKLANEGINEFGGARPSSGFNQQSGSAASPQNDVASAPPPASAPQQQEPAPGKAKPKTEKPYRHNYAYDEDKKNWTPEIKAIKALNENTWLYPEKKTELILEQVRNVANIIAQKNHEFTQSGMDPDEHAEEINKMIFSHMNAMEWLHTRTDYRLHFLLDLHEAGVTLPKALTEDDVPGLEGGPLDPYIPKDGTDEIASNPIINWAALQEAQEIIDLCKVRPELRGKRPDFYYGFKIHDTASTKPTTFVGKTFHAIFGKFFKKRSAADTKLANDIYDTVNAIWHIEMTPAGTDAETGRKKRVERLTTSGGLLAELGNHGPGNRLALIQLCYSLRGKRFRGALSEYYEQKYNSKPTQYGSDSEKRIAALMRAIFKKRPTKNEENDNDIFSFQEYDTGMHRYGHEIDSRLVSERFWHGIIGLGFRDDGKYKPYFPTLLNPLNWSPRNTWNFIVDDLWGQRYRYHTHGASVDEKGKRSWGAAGWEGKRNIKWGFTHEWTVKVNNLNPAMYALGLANSFRVAARNQIVRKPKLATIWRPAAMSGNAPAHHDTHEHDDVSPS
ncbi:MAG TPA: hypothetical protein PLO23_00310 [Alphaproteobacteria bacterium]|nr:hypothetical protein [Alphaproteobacteria bacterium]